MEAVHLTTSLLIKIDKPDRRFRFTTPFCASDDHVFDRRREQLAFDPHQPNRCGKHQRCGSPASAEPNRQDAKDEGDTSREDDALE
jgi:hypothetical protein